MSDVEIVTCPGRKILSLGDVEFVYIPLSPEEREKYAPQIEDPCWRIQVHEGLTSAQREEVCKIVQSALDTGSA